ncbi:large T antigen [Betapolyomavirus mastomysis]|uniref:DNA 3'-5' helicase n=1 Tax=Betapolyomavirus mastomysis TaxID=1891768 RepID=E5RUP4_9POLY|nr:large T antigen [Betapolyomavirus mastomysis]BAJ53087.1 large T antigen [Betapolyomavirus mastomysis]
MDHTLTREESLRLMELLQLPMEQYGNFPLMRKAFLARCRVLHPDKGGDQTLAKELITLYRKLEEHLPQLDPQERFSTDQIPTYGTEEWEAWWRNFNQDYDLFCNEMFDASDEEELPQSQSQKRPPSPEEEEPQTSQATPPKKKKPAETPKDIPKDLKEFLSNAILSNKTITAFLVYTTLEKSQLLYKKLTEKYKPVFISRHKLETEGFVYMLTPGRHRVSAVANYCSTLCSISFLVVKGIIKEIALYNHLCVAPYAVLQENLPGGLNSEFFDMTEEAKNVCWTPVCQYALDIMCDDVYLLMGLYKEFAVDVNDCKKCNYKVIPDHYDHHRKHHANALLFVESRNQKTICQQAVDGVIAQRRVDVAQLSRKEQLGKRFEKLLHKMESLFSANSPQTITMYMAGVTWYNNFFAGINMKDFVLEYLECMVTNIPKKRYWLFTGPVNTGKTTLAAALLDLCGGKSLNINTPFDKINFELGVAIDQFSVVFEDVKGQQADNKDLPSGQGISNLDNLRDYLDGAVKVNLEKKHLNKKTQIFPPGIVTCNEYKLPITLRVRFCKKIKFTFQKNQYLALKKTEDLQTYRILQSGITLLMLLIYYCDVEDFLMDLQPLILKWKTRINEEVTVTAMSDMDLNCKEGKDILGKREATQEDSGIF